MTTEYFEQQIERFKQEGKLPEDFEIAEIKYYEGGKEILAAVGCANRKALPADTGGEPKHLLYAWGDEMGKLVCVTYDWQNDYGDSKVVRWNDATERPEFIDVIYPWTPAYGLDIGQREPR